MENKKILGATLALLFLIPTLAFAQEVGLAAIDATFGSQTMVYDSKTTSVRVVQDGPIKITLSFVAMDSGKVTYLVAAPWASYMISSEGEVKGEPASTTMDIELKRGKSFGLTFIGTPKQSSYIDVFRAMPDGIVRITHFDVEVSAPQVTKQVAEQSPTNNRLKIAEAAVADAKAKGFKDPVIDLKLENARLFIERNEAEATKLLSEITEAATSHTKAWNELSAKISSLKQEISDDRTLKDAAGYLVRAEEALKSGDLKSASTLVNKAEEMIRPDALQKVVRKLQTREALMAMAGIAVLAVVVMYKRISKRAGVVGLRNLL